jgi:hypothetical protein
MLKIAFDFFYFHPNAFLREIFTAQCLKWTNIVLYLFSGFDYDGSWPFLAYSLHLIYVGNLSVLSPFVSSLHLAKVFGVATGSHKVS